MESSSKKPSCSPSLGRALLSLCFCCVGHNLRLLGGLALIACIPIGVYLLFDNVLAGLATIVGAIVGLFLLQKIARLMIRFGEKIIAG